MPNVKFPSLQHSISVIKDYVKTLPSQAGVYRMLNIEGKVLYIGKAKNLKKRVNSYTKPERLSHRLQRMVAETTRMEFVTTHTEAEALLLEANLIKKLEPRYNILMRDGKSFAYLRISENHPYPLLAKHRGPRNLPGDYYGPFASAESVNTTLTTLHRAFLLRSCSDKVFATRKRPCLQYQIKRCCAPCVGYIDQQDYNDLVKQAKDFLRGKSTKIQQLLAEKMQHESEQKAYEKAAIYRDRIRALTTIQSKQSINTLAVTDADIFAIYQSQGKTCIQIFIFRNSSNFGTYAAFPIHGKDIPISEVLESFLAQFYEDSLPPHEILLSEKLTNPTLMKDALSQRAKSRIIIHTPLSGKKLKLVTHALDNAKDALERKLAESTSQRQLMKELSHKFNLPITPQRIEIYDNSHIQGKFPVGCMVVAGPEGYIKKAYRKFNIKSTTISPGDDFAMLREVLTRRFSRALAEDKVGTTQWPNLLIIDGGAGQLSSAQSVFDDLGITDISLVAIAKGPKRNAGQETFYVKEKKPFQLPFNDPILYYMQRLRDEAHRFAIGTHRARRLKTITQSKLDSIPGIGAKRKRLLLNHFGSIKAIEGSGIDDLQSVEGISKNCAKKIYEYFHSKG